MLKEAIVHESDSSYAYAVSEKSLLIKLKTKRNDLEKVILFYGDRYEPKKLVNFHEKEMDIVYRDDLYDYYEVIITPPFNRICYYFKLIGGSETSIYSQGRFYLQPPRERNQYYMFPYICKGDLYDCYEWWQDQIVYLVFVDRFNTENPGKDWYRKPKCSDVFGGTLKGILDKLDYLSDLGINCLCLTPIFQSDTCHKYDTIDYYKIDEGFGDEDTFKQLVDECHKRGIRVILDAVFNHTSNKFFAFKDAIKNGEHSKYKDWYFIRSKDDYETFASVKEMPKLNTANPEVAEYLLGIARYWIEKFDIDGWRLDVANEIDHKFWRKFRETVKQAKKDAFILGEAWDGAESYLQGDQYDSAMNYPFMYLTIDYFARQTIDTKRFDECINNLYARYRKFTRTILLNLFDSHDTSRFLYECKRDVHKMMQAVFFKMTCIGIPMMFYGDEAGLCGANDPDCRRTINFKKINRELFDFYKKMIAIRKEYKVLRNGEFRTVLVDGDVYAYSRHNGEDEIICVLNRSDHEAGVTLNIKGSRVLDLLNHVEYKAANRKLDLRLKPGDMAMLREI